MMELNEKYQGILDKMRKTIEKEDVPGLAVSVACGLILRQTLELHQKIDRISYECDNTKKVIDYIYDMLEGGGE